MRKKLGWADFATTSLFWFHAFQLCAESRHCSNFPILTFSTQIPKWLSFHLITPVLLQVTKYWYHMPSSFLQSSCCSASYHVSMLFCSILPLPHYLLSFFSMLWSGRRREQIYISSYAFSQTHALTFGFVMKLSCEDIVGLFFFFFLPQWESVQSRPGGSFKLPLLLWLPFGRSFHTTWSRQFSMYKQLLLVPNLAHPLA